MLACPLCLHENSPTAIVCEHCGRFRFRESAETDLADSGPLTEPTRFKPPAPLSELLGPTPAGPTLPNVPQTKPAPPARLVVIRGQNLHSTYPIYAGANYLGRSDDQPADIDLSGIEPPDQIWSSRKHAVIRCEDGALSLEDLNSLNGTFVNRARAYAGKRYQLKNNDIIQIGSIQLRVVV